MRFRIYRGNGVTMNYADGRLCLERFPTALKAANWAMAQRWGYTHSVPWEVVSEDECDQTAPVPCPHALKSSNGVN